MDHLRFNLAPLGLGGRRGRGGGKWILHELDDPGRLRADRISIDIGKMHGRSAYGAVAFIV